MLGFNMFKSCKNGEYYVVNIDCDKDVFLDALDYYFFLSLLGNGVIENNFVEILAYSLEPRQLKILLFQANKSRINKLLADLLNAYNRYYLKKYKIKNLLGKANCVVVKVSSDSLLDVSRDIHLLPDMWIDHPYSSIRAYFYDDAPDWLSKYHIADIYGSAVDYCEFMMSI